MEHIFLYFLKSSGLITTFYLAYYFLLKKETFFNSNRWYLLIGMFTAVLLPLFTFKKIKLIEIMHENGSKTLISNGLSIPTLPITNEISINWYSTGFWIYFGIAILLLLKIIFNLFQVFNSLRKKEISKQESFNYVDSDEVVAPFSFFKYIVFNSKLYSSVELESILEHEKVHSLQVHSLDVLVANVFQVIFWFNPIVYFYKKSIIQNLEFIADSNAIAQFEDKKHYQMTLLKVVSYQNCLPITNHFYQSLIKKRIIMLNKNQSKKVNAWKYSLIIPVLIAFVMLFQVTVVAQTKYFKEIKNADGSTTRATAIIAELEYSKNSTEKEFESDALNLKKDQNVDLKFSNIKRNSQGEIIEISVSFDDHKGSKGEKVINSDSPIKPFKFLSKTFANGKIKIGFYDDENESDAPLPPSPPKVPTMKSLMAPPNPPSPPKKNKKQVYNSSAKEKEEIKLAINKQKIAIEDSKIEIEKSKRIVEESKKEVEESKIAMVEAKKSFESSKIEIQKAKSEFINSKEEIIESRKKVAEARKQVAEARKQIDDARKEIDDARKESLKKN